MVFNTIDYAVLLKRLHSSFGITGTVYSWLQSYLTGRTQSVRIGIHSSPVTPSLVGVPQGSILGLLLFFTSYFQKSSKDILLAVSLPHFSCPPCLEYLCPCSLILLRLWRYINHVLTYLLTSSIIVRGKQ